MSSKGLHLARIADIEGTGRAANEVIAREIQAPPDGAPQAFRCECGDETCSEPLSIPREIYERVRGDAMRFIVRPEHVVPEAETVKEKGDGFWIVYKNEDVRSQVEASDPRS